MRPAPIKPEYGPTLPQLLGPRWQRASRLTRRALIAGAVFLVALVALAVIATWPSSISGGRPVSFHFDYADHLHRVKPQKGEYARVEAHSRGLLAASFAVAP